MDFFFVLSNRLLLALKNMPPPFLYVAHLSTSLLTFIVLPYLNLEAIEFPV